MLFACIFLTASIAGFGLGALNEAEDDDVDVYDNGLPSAARRLAFEAGDEDDNRPSLKKTGTASLSVGSFDLL